MRRLFFILGVAALFLPGTRPARGQISVVGALAHEQEAPPGATYQGSIQLRNQTSEFQEARVYSTDYLFFADGTTLYSDAGSHERSNAEWITLEQTALSIPPNQTVPLTYSVTVPDEADLSGTYWSMIMVEGVAPREAGDDQQIRLQTTMRYGVQVATHVPNEQERSVSFSNTTLFQTDDGHNMLQVDLVNDGNTLIRPEVWVELYDEQGAASQRFDGSQRRIYPGTSIRQQIDLGVIGEGRYRALLFVDAGGSDVFGTEYTLEL